MTVSTHGMRLKTPSHALRTGVELLSSMRFSISLLTVICIASVIGTVLKQGEPVGNYVNQFGPFWADVFGALSLPTVYGAWWFLLILAFLVLSTSLCISRNAPKIIGDLNVLKEGMREQSLKAFGHRAENTLAESAETAAQRIGSMLASSGWKVKLQTRDDPHNPGTPRGYMVAAKAGSANKLGYIAAHSAIVLVCVGGLLDGDLFIRAQTWFNGKSVFGGGGMIADIPAQHRLGAGNLAFRGNMLVAEGAKSSTAILNQPGGVLIQDLPFSIELKKFIVEYYSTGMPKLFASEITITDKETGEKIPARVEVNHPARHRGVEIYQSSFDDGGSSVKLRSVPLTPQAKAFDIEGTIGGSSNLTNGPDKMTLEYTALRVINVENFGAGAGAGSSGSGVDVRKVDLRSSLDERLGAANKIKTTKELRNVGPSISYKLRDASGQAREYHNYMQPVVVDADANGAGQAVYLFGMRENPADAFSYLRIPADEKGSLDGFVRLRLALADPAQRAQAVRRYVAKAVEPGKPELAAQLTVSAERALSLFAGAEAASAAKATKVSLSASGPAPAPATAGLQAISAFMEKNVPEAERGRAGDVLVRILNGTLFELAQAGREKAGLPALLPDEKTQAFMAQAVLSLSDTFLYPAPMVFVLNDFTQVQASVFQLARAPGKWIVYSGCLFLILGVFAMLYIRERRLWVWLTPAAPDAAGGASAGAEPASHAQMALSTNRKTMDGDKEFEHLRAKLIGLTQKAPA